LEFRRVLFRSPAAKLVGIDPRLAEVDTAPGHLLRLLDDASGVEQRLRRDAADVEADAAERRPALDQRDVEPEVRRAERRRVAARARAEHDEPRAGTAACPSALDGRRGSGRPL